MFWWALKDNMNENLRSIRKIYSHKYYWNPDTVYHWFINVLQIKWNVEAIEHIQIKHIGNAEREPIKSAQYEGHWYMSNKNDKTK